MEKKPQNEESTPASPSSLNTTISRRSATKVKSSNLSFLGMPLETRSMIYDLLLVCRTTAAGALVGKLPWASEYPTPQGVIIWGDAHGVALNILRTCKQIHQEAIDVLYSRNAFDLMFMRDITTCFASSGTTFSLNIKYVKSLSVLVYDEETPSWVEFLNTLATEALKLRDLRVVMHGHRPSMTDQEWPDLGMGDNLEFVRALGKIRGLKKFTIEGYYSNHWPAYLEKEIGIQIVAHRGRTHETQNVDGKTISSVTPRELQFFEGYQKQIEDMVP